jgi:hypothetical protein
VAIKLLQARVADLPISDPYYLISSYCPVSKKVRFLATDQARAGLQSGMVKYMAVEF